MDTRSQSTKASWINVAAGVWLIIAPFVLNYANSTPKTNDIWLGIIVGVLALIRAFSPDDSKTQWLNWINILAGIWLIVAPFVLGYAYTIPRWNDLILGTIVLVVAIWSTGVSAVSTRGHAHA